MVAAPASRKKAKSAASCSALAAAASASACALSARLVSNLQHSPVSMAVQGSGDRPCRPTVHHQVSTCSLAKASQFCAPLIVAGLASGGLTCLPRAAAARLLPAPRLLLTL